MTHTKGLLQSKGINHSKNILGGACPIHAMGGNSRQPVATKVERYSPILA
jgi:hypothetical protein